MRFRAEANCVQVLRHDAPRPRQPGHVAALQKEEVNRNINFATFLGVNSHLRFKYILSCLFLRKNVVNGIYSFFFTREFEIGTSI